MNIYTFRFDAPLEYSNNIIDIEKHLSLVEVVKEHLSNEEYIKTFLTQEIATKSRKIHYHGIIETQIHKVTLRSRLEIIFKKHNLSKSQFMLPQLVRNKKKSYDYFLKDLKVIYQKGFELQEFTNIISSAVEEKIRISKSPRKTIMDILLENYEPLPIQKSLRGNVCEKDKFKVIEHVYDYVQKNTKTTLYSKQHQFRYIQTLLHYYYDVIRDKQRNDDLEELKNIYL